MMVRHNVLHDFHTLKLDLDGKCAKRIEEVGVKLLRLAKFFQMSKYRITEKKSRHGRHVTITFMTLKTIRDEDLVFMQLYLGSHPDRELFNWLRVRSSVKQWNALFKRKFDSEMRQIGEETDIKDTRK